MIMPIFFFTIVVTKKKDFLQLFMSHFPSHSALSHLKGLQQCSLECQSGGAWGVVFWGGILFLAVGPGPFSGPLSGRARGPRKFSFSKNELHSQSASRYWQRVSTTGGVCPSFHENLGIFLSFCMNRFSASLAINSDWNTHEHHTIISKEACMPMVSLAGVWAPA